MSVDRNPALGTTRLPGEPFAQARDGPNDEADFAPAAALALLIPDPAGRCTLVVGSDQEAIVRSIAFLGGRAVACDPCDTAASSVAPRPKRGKSHGGELTFPFRSDSFDSIVLNRVLEWIGRGSAGPALRAQRALLRECWRILKPGGTLLLGAENRFSRERLRQQWPDPVTGGRYLGMLPLPLADLVSRFRHGRPYGFSSHSLHGWISLLEEEGFAFEDVKRFWPAERVSRELEFGESLTRATEWVNPLVRRGSISVKVSRFIRQPGIKRLFAPAFLLGASKPGEAGDERAPPSVLSRIAEKEEVDEQLASLTLRVRQTSETISFVSGSSFVKIPLTASARDRVSWEAKAHTHLRDRPVSRWMLDPVQFKGEEGLSYITYPAMTLRLIPRSADDLRRHYDLLLVALGEDVRAVRLHDTEFWELVFAPDIVTELHGLGAGAVLARLEASADRSVPSGVVHGDMARNNLLVTTEGMRVIDWDRWEDPSPHFIDVVAASFSVGRAEGLWGQHDRATQVRLVAAGDPRVPFLERLEWAAGDLSLAEALAFRMLSRATRQRLYHPGNRGFDAGLREYFEVCATVI